MAQATKTRKLKKRSEPSEGPLQTFTDSVERIGGDPAIFGLVMVSAFSALGLGANPWAVFGLAGLVIFGWPLNKYVNQRGEERKEELALDRLREERGIKILEKQGQSSTQLTFLDNGDDQ